jgi:hypothetical protein
VGTRPTVLAIHSVIFRFRREENLFSPVNCFDTPYIFLVWSLRLHSQVTKTIRVFLLLLLFLLRTRLYQIFRCNRDILFSIFFFKPNFCKQFRFLNLSLLYRNIGARVPNKVTLTLPFYRIIHQPRLIFVPTTRHHPLPPTS